MIERKDLTSRYVWAGYEFQYKRSLGVKCGFLLRETTVGSYLPVRGGDLAWHVGDTRRCHKFLRCEHTR
jgi:hypothetical protein